ncbi:GDSL-type esterase/lipase family protein [Maribellus mangrovi]|uniref:GDSL-type esterase/lipase family protein n=1 Tax=Maribellus mangrovi TaxID=3133146 RepID=UPI0030EF520A
MKVVQSSEFRVQSSEFKVQGSGFRVCSGLYKTFSLIAAFLLLFNIETQAQEEAYLYHLNPYNFIRYDLNQMHYPGGRQYSDQFQDKLQDLLTRGEGKINIVHIGGSHIQAGSFSGEMRTRFQQLNGGMNAGWGFMFPYRISRTNSPFGYYIRYNGAWRSFRNVERKKSGTLGVGGIAVTTASPKAELTILLEDENQLDYSFNQLRIYYSNKANNYEVSVDSTLVKSVNKTDDYVDFTLNEYVDSLNITLLKQPEKPGEFTLFGMTTEKAPNGILYHSIGVNGAHVPAFLRCQLFREQLAELQPDVVILGVGINDAYGRRFSQARFEDNYDQLITKIKRATPEALIIFTTNNDSYLYRRYVNKNGLKVRESMYKMAEKYKAGVWDMFEVMGGLNSIVLWQKNNLAQSDKIHFTREGYLLIADLFFTAWMQDFEAQLQLKNKIAETSDTAEPEDNFSAPSAETDEE